MPNITHLYYVHPGNVQCRVYYAGPHDLDINPNLNPRDSYAKHPNSWKEVGLVNAQGKLVCLEPHHPGIYADLKAQEPIYGGSVFNYSDSGEPQ